MTDPAGGIPAGSVTHGGSFERTAAQPSRVHFGNGFDLSIAAKQALFAYAILFPTLAIIVIFRFFPMLQAFYISLHEYDLIRPPTFIWFRQFH